MKDTKKILRLAIFNALSGVISVPVFEEKMPSGNTANMFVLLMNQQETSEENNDQCFITKSSIDIEINQKTETEVSKDDVDDLYQEIMEILLPDTQSVGLTIPIGFQFQNAFRESCVTQTVVLSETETVIIERFKLVFTITQK